MSNLIKKIFKSKVVDLDNDGKIESLSQEIEGVFSQFKRMDEKLTRVNDELAVVIVEEEKAKEEAKNRIDKAKAQIENNKKLQNKVQDFIV